MKQLIYMLFLAIILIGCNQTAQKADAEHAHEAKLQLTEYSNNMELFAEADPFAVGHNSVILAHFSWLENFKPLESGDVTLSLIVGENGVKQTLSQSVRPGIYKFEIQPQVAGVGKIIFDINSDEGKTQIIVKNIIVYDDKHDAEHAAEEIVVSETNATFFTKEQSWKIDFKTEYPSVEPFGQVIKTLAKIESASGNEIVISAKTSGIIVFPNVNLLEGSIVTTGQQLFSISSGEMSDNNLAVRLTEAKSNFENAEADYKRKEELVSDRIISENEFFTAKNNYETTKAVYQNLTRNFSATGQRVTSSMSGFIKQIFVSNGQYVDAGQPLITISQNQTLVLIAYVQQQYISLLASIHSANIKTLYDKKTYTLQELNGVVLSYGKSVSADNYLLPVNLQIDNKGSFVQGSFVEVYLKTLNNSKALTVPNTAILEEQSSFFVFVQIHPELFEKREVKIGGTDGMRTEILSGLLSTERIISKGAMLVKLSQLSESLDPHAGHVH